MKTQKRHTITISILVWLLQVTTSQAVTELAQFGITWRFASNVQYGQYANGDYWVVGPVDIIQITPASTNISGRIINGSMVNPKAGEEGKQGFDSAMYGMYSESYDPALNAARPNGSDLTQANPLRLPPGSSLISTISHPTAGQRPQLTDAAILTVVQSPPVSGSFRPPYQGTDKNHKWNSQNVDYSIFRSLTPPADSTPFPTLVNYFERPWIEINTNWSGRYMHPSNNQPDYGRDMAFRLGNGLLGLHYNYNSDQKRLLCIRMIQIGIDFYGAARTGALWRDLGGHNQGRKAPLILAALALRDSEIAAYGDANRHFIFQEDRQTWIVGQSDVGRLLYTADGRPREQYTQLDVGIPEWGEQHTSKPNRDGRNWDAYYRDIAGTSLIAHALFAHLTPDAVSTWNWAPFFSYMDRFVSIESSKTNIPSALRNAWQTYRALGNATLAPTPPANAKISITSSPN